MLVVRYALLRHDLELLSLPHMFPVSVTMIYGESAKQISDHFFAVARLKDKVDKQGYKTNLCCDINFP